MGKVTWDPPEYYGIELDRQTDWQKNRTENITFPQTTYAGGNNLEVEEIIKYMRNLKCNGKYPHLSHAGS